MDGTGRARKESSNQGWTRVFIYEADQNRREFLLHQQVVYGAMQAWHAQVPHFAAIMRFTATCVQRPTQCKR
jgi:hypothetical protein